MKFTKDALAGIVDGTTTVTFRGWKRAHAKVGGRHRIWGMLIEIVDVALVDPAEITDAEAGKAGAASGDAVLSRLGEAARGPVWRVEFRYLGHDDRIDLRNSADLDDERRAAIRLRLGRMDRASRSGPWTRKTLRLIATSPGVVSTTLARQMDTERAPFKINVRKLKELGLTESLDIGYRLSPLGAAFLDGDA